MTNYAGLDIVRNRLNIHPIAEYDPYNVDDESYSLWKDFIDTVQSEILDGSQENTYFVIAEQMTWENLTGHNLFYTTDAEQFMRQAIGLDCDCIIRIWKTQDGSPYSWEMTVYHHDSPTGEIRKVYTGEQAVAAGYLTQQELNDME